MRTLMMGNKHLVDYQERPDGETERIVTEQDGVTEVRFSDEVGLTEAFQTITLPQGIHDAHFEAAPAWVSCPSWPALEALLSDHFDCPTRKAKG